MKRLVIFCGRKFCVSIIVFVFFYMGAAVKNVGNPGQSLWFIAPVLAQSRPSEAAAPEKRPMFHLCRRAISCIIYWKSRKNLITERRR